MAARSKDKGKGKGEGGGKGEKERQEAKVSIYTIARDVFQKATADLAAEGMKRETASEIFKNQLAGTLERLFKEVATQHALQIPAGKAPGLGTYYRTIRDAMRSGRGSGSAVLDASSVMMEEFCTLSDNQAARADVQQGAGRVEGAVSSISERDGCQFGIRFLRVPL